jgi:hypothetical protein
MCVWFEHKPINGWFDWHSRRLVAADNIPPNSENRAPCFALNFWPTFARLYLAHWLLAVVAGFLAMVPWCPRRFSIRGLLVAVTVVAVAAAIINWVDRTF